LIVARPDLMRSADTSLSRTGNPASEHTWAMPLPIWPAPMTPTLRMLRFIPLVRIAGAALGRRPFTTIAAATPRCRAAATAILLNLLAVLAEFGREFGEGLVEVGDEAVVGDLEDRRLLVLVDRHDHLGVLHAGE